MNSSSLSGYQLRVLAILALINFVNYADRLLSNLFRNVPFLTSLEMSPLKLFGCCVWCWGFFRVPTGAEPCVRHGGRV